MKLDTTTPVHQRDHPIAGLVGAWIGGAVMNALVILVYSRWGWTGFAIYTLVTMVISSLTLAYRTAKQR